MNANATMKLLYQPDYRSAVDLMTSASARIIIGS